MRLPRSPFGSVCHLVNGKAFKPTDWSSAGVPIIRIQNLNGPNKPFNFWAGALDKQVLVKTGDLLLAWSGTPGTSFGAHIWTGPQGILNQHIFRCDLDQKTITKEWARIAVNHRLYRLIEQAHGGVGLQHVTRGMVEDLEIPLPPLAEQKRIAQVLDRAEALRAKRRTTLAQLDSLRQSIFHGLFGPNGTHRSICVTAKLGSLCQSINDGVHKTPSYIERGVPFVTVKNIASGELDLSGTKFISEDDHKMFTRRTKPERGDILVTKDGTIGVPCPIATDAEFSIFVSVALLKPKFELIDQSFLVAQFQSDWVQRQIRAASKGIAIRHLHLEDFKRLMFIVPPVKLQREFARRVRAVEKLKAAQRASLVEMDALFATLQHRAFRGEL